MNKTEVVAGPSNSGKTAAIKMLEKDYKTLHINMSDVLEKGADIMKDVPLFTELIIDEVSSLKSVLQLVAVDVRPDLLLITNNPNFITA